SDAWYYTNLISLILFCGGLVQMSRSSRDQPTPRAQYLSGLQADLSYMTRECLMSELRHKEDAYHINELHMTLERQTKKIEDLVESERYFKAEYHEALISEKSHQEVQSKLKDYQINKEKNERELQEQDDEIVRLHKVIRRLRAKEPSPIMFQATGNLMFFDDSGYESAVSGLSTPLQPQDLAAENRGLHNEVKQLGEKLRKQESSARDQVDKKQEKTLRELRAANDSLSKKTGLLEQKDGELQAANSTISQLQGDVRQCGKTNENLQENVRRLEERNDQLGRTVRTLEAQNTEATAAKDAAKAEKAEAISAIDDANREREKAKSELSTAEQSLVEKSGLLKEMENELHAAKAEVSRLQGEAQQPGVADIGLRAENELLRNHVKNQDNRIQSLDGETTQLQTKRNALKNGLDGAQSYIDKFHIDVGNMLRSLGLFGQVNNMSQLQVQVHTWKDEKCHFESELRKSQKSLEELKQEYSRLQQILSQAQISTLSDLSQKLGEKVAECDSLKTQLAKKQEALVITYRERTALQNKRSSLEMEAQKWKTKAEEAEREKKGGRAINDHYQQQNLALRDQKQDLDGKVIALQDQVQELTGSCDQLQHGIQDLEGQKKTIEENVQQLKVKERKLYKVVARLYEQRDQNSALRPEKHIRDGESDSDDEILRSTKQQKKREFGEGK
ncbi:MAG: hypothetical protein Q9181_005179, partial [Wetmoreana brouardii]